MLLLCMMYTAHCLSINFVLLFRQSDVHCSMSVCISFVFLFRQSDVHCSMSVCINFVLLIYSARCLSAVFRFRTVYVSYGSGSRFSPNTDPNPACFSIQIQIQVKKTHFLQRQYQKFGGKFKLFFNQKSRYRILFDEECFYGTIFKK